MHRIKLRVPAEPDPPKSSSRPGVTAGGIVLPRPFDFSSSPVDDETATSERLREYVDEAVKTSLDFCCSTREDPAEENDSPSLPANCIETVFLPIKLFNRHRTLQISVETVPVVGVSDPGLKAVRHAVRLPVRPDVLFDAVCRFCYTEAVDPFLDRVDVLERYEEAFEDDGDRSVSWCHVTYTVDRFAPVMSARDFVSVDLASEKHLLYFSRSCIHPDRPPKPVPGPLLPKQRSRAYRVPFMFCQHVIPDPSDPDACTLVQFQFSDIGGILKPSDQIAAVVRFGTSNIPKLLRLVDEFAYGLGEGQLGYMQDPLLNLVDRRPRTKTSMMESNDETVSVSSSSVDESSREDADINDVLQVAVE